MSPGSDTCGSIRLPANYCGVTGLKPTYGAVSRYGVVAMASSLDTMGHITRSVADSERIFMITAGPDGKDSTLVDFRSGKHGVNKKLKVGIPKEFIEQGVDREVRGALESFIKWLENAGHKVSEVSLPSSKYANSAYYIIQPAEVSSNLGRYDGVRYGLARDAFGMEAKRRIMLGTFALSSGYYDAYYDKAMKVRTLLINEVEKVYEDADLLLAPVAPTLPFKLVEKVTDPLKMYLTDIFAATANLTGIPSLALPNGFTKDNLPVGIQLMGKKFGEKVLFSLGKQFQSQTDYHLKTP